MHYPQLRGVWPTLIDMPSGSAILLTVITTTESRMVEAGSSDSECSLPVSTASLSSVLGLRRN